MAVNTEVLKSLLENGVHFGHQASKWNPKMKRFIFGKKSGIYIIDLESTEKALQKACDFLQGLARSGKKILFVGTKKQAKQVVKEEAERTGMFYVDERWLGGCLTNFGTIRKSISRLDYLENIKKSETYSSLAKKEKVKMDREEEKLKKNLLGIRHMDKLPGAVIIIDSEDEKIAVFEAKKLEIPVVALLDTNCDPDLVNYPIPGNDDAIRSIKYICSSLANAILKGSGEFAAGTFKKEAKPEQEEAKKEPAEKKEIKPAENIVKVEKTQKVEKTEPAKDEKLVKNAKKPAKEAKDPVDGDISLG
ncbi:MAG: 30S ribosomal protein S2 [Candidatus Omnitrophica bacterium]|nr:30S ribosomal protein S2 [Candidatus Omnitrophota bacterium]